MERTFDELAQNGVWREAVPDPEGHTRRTLCASKVAIIAIVALGRVVWGADDPCSAQRNGVECARILSNLGTVYYSQARYQEAERLFVRAIALWSSSDAQAADLAITLHNLAAVYRSQARYPEAIQSYERALDLRESLYGRDATVLLPLLNGLGASYLELGDYKRSQPVVDRALSIVELNRIEGTADAAATFGAFGALFKIRGQLPEAENWLTRALAVYRQTGQTKDESTVLNSLGRVMLAQRHRKEAERMFRQAIAEAELQLGAEHPDVAAGLSNLANLLGVQHQYAEAERLLHRAEQIDRKSFPADDTRLGSDAYNAGVLAFERKKYSIAEPLFQECVAIFEKRLPPNHPEIGKVTASLAELYRREGRFEESETLYRKALQILELNWGPENPQLLSMLDSYSLVLRTRQEYAQAASIDMQAMKIRVTQALRSGD
jgi:tetratricopeptide (TPR) repeat protein